MSKFREGNFFGQKLPVMLASMLFVVLIFRISFEMWEVLCEAIHTSGNVSLLEIILIVLKKTVQIMTSDSMRNLGLLLAASIGWYFLSRRTNVAEREAIVSEQNIKITEQNIKITEQNIKTNEQKIVDEQISRAIERLAGENPFIRLNSISDLEKISLTHEEESKKIARILVSFIRTRATKDSEENKLKKTEEFDAYREQRLDIETAVNVLARIASNLEKQKQLEQRGDNKYHLCNLENLDLRGLRLEDVDLSKFNLEGTDFSGAWLRRTDLSGAHLFKFVDSKVLRAIFFRTHLDHASFTGAYLNHVIFIRADLSSAKFDNVILQNVNFDGALVNGTHFESSDSLTQEQIDKAYYWGNPPHLPDGLELPPKESYYRPEDLF